jgi:hypothetical protein
MASKKKIEEQSLATVPTVSTALTTMEQEMAAEAKDLSAQFAVTSTAIRFNAQGQILVGDNEVDNPLPVIIVDQTHLNAYYSGPYDPDEKVPPDCFAFGNEEKGMKPHPDAIDPQHSDCATCPHNQYGTKGKGKACRNKVRLMCMSASVDGAGVATAEVLRAEVPPTSLSAFASYVAGLRGGNMTPRGVITEIKSEGFKTYFKISFRPVGKVTGEVWAALKARMPAVKDQMNQPFKAKAEVEKTAKAPAKGKKKF